MGCQAGVCFRQLPEVGQLIVRNVCPVLLGKQILIDPEVPGSGKNEGTVLILPQPLLEYAASQVVCLPQSYLLDGRTKLLIGDVRLPGSLGKPGGLESPHRSVSRIYHEGYCSTRCNHSPRET